MAGQESKNFWENILKESYQNKLNPKHYRFIERVSKRLVAYVWYLFHPRAERYSYYDHPNPGLILADFNKNGLQVINLNAHNYLSDFRSYLRRSRDIYRDAGYFRLFDENGYYYEKALEHYLSLNLLELSERDLVLDVGAWGSPYLDIAKRERM